MKKGLVNDWCWQCNGTGWLRAVATKKSVRCECNPKEAPCTTY